MSDTSATDDLDALLAQVASRTEALRSAGDAASDEAARLLLADLTRVAARLRADAAAIGHSLAAVLDGDPPGADTTGDQP